MPITSISGHKSSVMKNKINFELRSIMRENYITFLVMLAALICVTFWADASFNFQKDCKKQCAPRLFMTPFVGMKEICLCDIGQGNWKKNLVSSD